MRLCMDTNIFVNALMDGRYKTAVEKFIDRQSSFLTLSLNNEIRRVILKIHTILVKISVSYMNQENKNNACFYEPDILALKVDYPNICSYLQKSIGCEGMEEAVEQMADISASMLTEIDRVRIHPPSEEEAKHILQRYDSQSLLLQRQIGNRMDVTHLILAEAFAAVFADDETFFVTDDHTDIINNKIYIEDVLNYVKVFDFKSMSSTL